MKIAFILSVAIIIGTLICIFGKKRDLKTRILIAILGGIISVAILVFPLIKEQNIVIKALESIFYAIKSVGLNQDISLLGNISLKSFDGIIYFAIMNALFIIMPVLTTGVILAFLSDIFTKIKLGRVINKNLYIFSELNDKSEMIAKGLKDKNNCAIIFANSKDKQTNIKCLRITEKMTDIHIKNKDNNVTFYAISSNVEENLNYSLELIKKYKDRKNTNVYVVNNTMEAPTILDSVDKGKVTVEIINETEREIYNLLDTKPLYENVVDNTISVLIVGCGMVGKEFLKNATWCAMMPGFKYKATVIDIKADKIEENIKVEAPEFLQNYDITFIQADIKSEKAIETIKKVEDINYILVSMETDKKNLDAAILLRRLFLKLYNRRPTISLWIQNEYKQEQITNLVNERDTSYDLYAFGSIKDMYFENIIVDSKIERLAKQVHLAYCSNDKTKTEEEKLEDYNKREYFKRSSRASALHIKYKIYSVLRDRFTNSMSQNQQLLKNIYSDEIENLLVNNEHDRWNAYTRSIGYTKASIDEVKKYYPETGRHENSLTRLHPALVENSELDKVSQELNKFIPNVDLRYSDEKIIRAITNEIKL